MPRRFADPPPGAVTSTLEVRVPFYDTDAMGVVHHARYVNYLELARVRLLEEHHRPYTDYVDRGLHFAVTRLEVDYHRGVGFDARLTVTAWLTWVRGASLGVGYAIAEAGAPVIKAVTEHAMVADDGRPRRIPLEDRRGLQALVAGG